MAVAGRSGKIHNIAAHMIVDSERRQQSREVICNCGCTMYQDSRDESTMWIFLDYSCRCGATRKYIVEK